MMHRLSLFLFFLFLALGCGACSEQRLPEVTIPAESQESYVKPLEFIDLSQMPPLGPTRMQTEMKDAYGNRNQVLEDLIATGKNSIPFLINQLEDETRIEHRVIPYWYRQSVGDIALVVLFHLFSDETRSESTVPGFWYDDFLERGKDKHLMGEEVLRRYIRKHGRKTIKQRWQKIWLENKENVFWDAPCRCFRVRSISK